jgi:hypothetical protein
MPLSNDKEKLWEGWLADGLGDKVAEVQQAMVASLQSRDMPKTGYPARYREHAVAAAEHLHRLELRPGWEGQCDLNHPGQSRASIKPRAVQY